ncbi:putative protein OS=Streptomyces aurantiogriseus OX=66870 GN=GCM10010251_21560 PE=4 SV=1 [Streptomyces aurantiogriseus]|uniref:Uncharacterized protein n=1 Tax=Streptomyces aurantiogriseus TaxID=66870 RepID=A0A918F571_9ACTN|nr:hypothetical protein GCM10010251_21560 [Streptomyces aurantiogriseus]
MTLLVNPDVPAEALTSPAPKRRGAPLLATADGRQGHLSRSAAPRRRGFPDPVSAPPASPLPPHPAPHCTPVPSPAHPTLRAIRVRRSPR